MMKQMAKMQRKMETLQEELGKQTLEVSGGGGAVKVTVSLQQKVEKITFDPEFLQEETTIVEEAVTETVQEALKQSTEKSEEAMQALTAEFQVPGMPSLF